LNSKQLLQTLYNKGANVTGTLKAVPKAFSYTVESKTKVAKKSRGSSVSSTVSVAAQAILRIKEEGSRSVYWFKSNNTFYCIMRQGKGKLVHMSTSIPELGPANWVFERDQKKYKRIHFDYRASSTSNSTTGFKFKDDKLLLTNAVELTLGQRDSLWFLLRSFMITSSTANNILSALFEYDTSNFSSCEEFSRIRRILNFEPASSNKGFINQNLVFATLMKSWFMKRLTGEGLSAGIKNEKHVMANIHNFLLQNSGECDKFQTKLSFNLSICFRHKNK
jgi:hypothetical protein